MYAIWIEIFPYGFHMTQSIFFSVLICLAEVQTDESYNFAKRFQHLFDIISEKLKLLKSEIIISPKI